MAKRWTAIQAWALDNLRPGQRADIVQHVYPYGWVGVHVLRTPTGVELNGELCTTPPINPVPLASIPGAIEEAERWGEAETWEALRRAGYYLT